MNVFVYGTLIPGQRLYTGIERFVKSYKDAEVENHQLHMASSGWYPVMTPGEGKVKGVLLEMEPEAIDRLDQIEGAPFLYKRVEIITTVEEKAWTYIGNHARPDVLIPNGDFLEFSHT